MNWKIIAEKPVAGGAHLTIGVGGYTLDTIIPDGPGREQIIEAYVRQVASLVAENEHRRAAAAKAPGAPAAKSGGCGCAGKKTLGLISLGKALLGGAASQLPLWVFPIHGGKIQQARTPIRRFRFRGYIGSFHHLKATFQEL